MSFLADKYSYRTNGSAAVDLHKVAQNTAQPLHQPERLPEAPVRERPAPRTRAKLAVAPFTVLAGLLAFVMMVMVVFSYVRFYEEKQAAAKLEAELAELNEEHNKLLSHYESVLDMDAVEERAKELGMSKPGASQTVYIQVAAGNTTEVYEAPQEPSLFDQVCDAFSSLFHDVVSYSP